MERSGSAWRCVRGGGHRCWRHLCASARPPSLGSPAHACNVSRAHRTISLDSDAVTRRAAARTRHRQPSSSMKAPAMQHAHTTPSTPSRWRVILGHREGLRVTSGAPGTAWKRCLWDWTCPVACAEACQASPLHPRWSLSSCPPLSLPHQFPRHRDRLWRLPPGSHVHPRRVALPLSLRALAAGALVCPPRAGSWGQQELRHPDSQPALSSGRTERPQRWGTLPPVSAVWCDATSCAVTRARHGERARRHPEPTTLVGRCSAECAVVPSSSLPRWRAGGPHLVPGRVYLVLEGLYDDWPREALTAARKVRDAATHPSMAH